MAGKVLSYLPNGLSERLLQKFLAKKDFKADENAMYLYKTIVQMIWPYDDQCRLVGEDVWEVSRIVPNSPSLIGRMW
jgi:hypothetical protein